MAKLCIQSIILISSTYRVSLISTMLSLSVSALALVTTFSKIEVLKRETNELSRALEGLASVSARKRLYRLDWSLLPHPSTLRNIFCSAQNQIYIWQNDFVQDKINIYSVERNIICPGLSKKSTFSLGHLNNLGPLFVGAS